MSEKGSLTHEELEAVRQDVFSSMHCALPGTVVSFDPERQTAEIQPAVRKDDLDFPVLADVPVFMPVPFDIHPGDACLVVFADVDIDAWFATGEISEPRSARKHSLSDGFAFIGFKAGGGLHDYSAC